MWLASYLIRYFGGHLAVQAWKKNGGDGQFLTGIQAERILVKEMRRKMEATRSEQRR
jgi:hypothetical protein